MTEEMLLAFGDPGLNLIIKALREAREEFENESPRSSASADPAEKSAVVRNEGTEKSVG